MPLDILAIGDTVIDNFIRLKDAAVHCKVNSDECEICMRWGDKIPFESATEVPAVGNAANAAVAGARLGLKTALRAYVGDDHNGEACLRALQAQGVDTTYVETQAGKRTNYHFVLWFESERTILIKHEAYEYAFPFLPQVPRWFYLSSLGENSLAYHQQILEALDKYPETKLAFQPGTFQIKMGAQALSALYRRSEIVFCNKEEAQLITGITSTDPRTLLTGMRKLGPKNAVITDGRNGAYAADKDGQMWFVPMYPDPRPPKERTGAGDAFASSVVSALALNQPLNAALLWGPVNSMEVVQEIGAQKGLVTLEKMRQFLADAPSGYSLQILA